MSWGPRPTRLCFLSSLRDCRAGEKVRFLGCVAGYCTASGRLRVEHEYPRGEGRGNGNGNGASVDINLLLERIQPECTRVGEWVNVVGYVVESPATGTAGTAGTGTPPGASASVQALLVWPTGPLDLGRYERSLHDMLAGG
ncbi:hypothetical protein ESCO_006303 [Escovopsis weberi]|uniref:CST complex subunit Ten1 n=1 Tax=Escovopsis weberi TaxID=150374 RepID=A0A0M8MWL3_ESCWE|nr:hypothetical protein ESCO_006303 [Escovopsis weberi]